MKHEELVEAVLNADPEDCAAYEAMEPEFQARRALIAARITAGLTQEELEAKIGTSQRSSSV